MWKSQSFLNLLTTPAPTSLLCPKPGVLLLHPATTGLACGDRGNYYHWSSAVGASLRAQSTVGRLGQLKGQWVNVESSQAQVMSVLSR